MEFRLSQSLSQTFLLHDGILAITEAFTNFSFTRWKFGYHGAFRELFFHTIGFSAITEPFANFSFTRLDFGYHGAFRELFFHTIGFSAIMEPFTNFSHGGTHKAHDLGEYSFHIYYKEYLHRIRLVKNLAT
jgi:hypothetical protein